MFTPATKLESRLRLGLCGTSGSGKTYTGLAIATALGKRVAVVDTEHGSAAKYSDLFKFDVLNLTSFEPKRFVAAIKAAEQAGYDVILLDSLSHAWMGTGGTLDQVEEAKRRNPNSFTAWRDPSKDHTELIEAILHARLHVIVTMRSKTEYVLQEDPRTGKKVPQKIGMAPVQRDGMEYEFDVVGDMQQGTLVISKTRCSAIADKSFHHPGAEFAGLLLTWLGGTPAPTPEHPAELNQRFKNICEAAGLDARESAQKLYKANNAESWNALPAAVIEAAITALAARVEAKPTVTSQHPVWRELIDAAQAKGLIYTTECALLMEAHGAVDASDVPLDAVRARIAEIQAMGVEV